MDIVSYLKSLSCRDIKSASCPCLLKSIAEIEIFLFVKIAFDVLSLIKSHTILLLIKVAGAGKLI